MTLLETFRRYEELIKALLPPTAVAGREPMEEASERAVYAPLRTYRQLIDFKTRYETMSREEFGQRDEELRTVCEQIENSSVFNSLDPVAAWSALALHVGGNIFIRDGWTDLASETFGRLARGQDESGRLLPVTSATHPEAGWYDELATLHAAASYAVQSEDRHVARAVAGSSSFIQREIEPDHATAQPWALFAFIWNEQTRPLADQVLHAVELRKNELDAASLILLEDALYCLQLFY